MLEMKMIVIAFKDPGSNIWDQTAILVENAVNAEHKTLDHLRLTLTITSFTQMSIIIPCYELPVSRVGLFHDGNPAITEL